MAISCGSTFIVVAQVVPCIYLFKLCRHKPMSLAYSKCFEGAGLPCKHSLRFSWCNEWVKLYIVQQGVCKYLRTANECLHALSGTACV